MPTLNPEIIREYDIRGVANRDFTDETCYLLGRAIGTFERRAGKRRITLGRDCRLHSPRIRDGVLRGLLDTVKATVIALMASLQEKERGLRQQLGAGATPGVRTGLSDIRLLRRWADRTLQTISVLERGQQDGDLRTLLSELAEFSEIVHAHDAEMAEERVRETR